MTEVCFSGRESNPEPEGYWRRKADVVSEYLRCRNYQSTSVHTSVSVLLLLALR